MKGSAVVRLVGAAVGGLLRASGVAVGLLVGEDVRGTVGRSILTGRHTPLPEQSTGQPSPRLHFPKSSLFCGTKVWNGG